MTGKARPEPPPKGRTIDFGAPDAFGAHVFRVQIPPDKESPVEIHEDFGLKGGEEGLPYEECRVVLTRIVWQGIADSARRLFNDRLKAEKQPTGRWKAGVTRVDRLLGKELCVLAWAAEHTGNTDELPVICTRWGALRPEERWWLFSMTAAEAGLAEDRARGWRKALYYALSDGKVERRAPRRRRPADETSPSQLLLTGEH